MTTQALRLVSQFIIPQERYASRFFILRRTTLMAMSSLESDGRPFKYYKVRPHLSRMESVFFRKPLGAIDEESLNPLQAPSLLLRRARISIQEPVAGVTERRISHHLITTAHFVVTPHCQCVPIVQLLRRSRRRSPGLLHLESRSAKALRAYPPQLP